MGPRLPFPGTALTSGRGALYVWCMARKVTTTVRLAREDAEALARARKDGFTASDLIRKGLRVVAARYYRDRRPPTTRLFVTTDAKLGEEEEVFRDLER
jgi:Arc/MetJ-type ribon-helix-helix transcriptional regulator